MTKKVVVIGGGLAGSEAAIYLAKQGISVDLYEMRPEVSTPVHKTTDLAELVCSNSLGSAGVENASGLLKEEITRLGSALIPAAKKFSVPAGGALAIDRDLFSAHITEIIENSPQITLKRQFVEDITPFLDAGHIVLVASGPLTTDGLAQNLRSLTQETYLHFYDAVAPIVEADSINMDIAYKMDRYNKSETPSYINCPMNEEQYNRFYDYLISAETIELKDFEKDAKFFEGCMPVEVIAKRGKDTLRFGPMKPVGLMDPRTNEKAHAVVQLRQDNAVGTLYNLVGFQTNLKWSCQKELLRLIPGLEQASIVRYGVMHRNTYMNSPKLLTPALSFKENSNLYFAGQLTGVEGYTESIATGLMAAINIKRQLEGNEPLLLEDSSILGALCGYITNPAHKELQPMNANWGIIRRLETPKKIRDKKERAKMYAKRALDYIDAICGTAIMR